MTDRLPIHAIDATGTRSGSTVLHGDGTWKAPAPNLLTTETNGIPDLVWDDNNNLVYTEAP